MKTLFVLGALATAGLCGAQIPNIAIHLDATFSYRIQQEGPPLARYYSILGRPSVLSLSTYLEQGFRVYVAEKLERIPGDTDSLDEYYIEDEGIWRVGKQYLPFGSGRILHEAALAARGDTTLIFEGLPVVIAFCDSGEGLQSGVTGRIGSTFGVSFAVGRHFGISGSSLTDVRLPEQASGDGHGWREVFGIDGSHRIGRWTIKAEAVSFRNGETALDNDMAVFDFGVTLDPKRGESMSLFWSHEEPDRANYYRLSGAFAMSKNVSFEPTVRFRGPDLYDLTAEIRVRF